VHHLITSEVEDVIQKCLFVFPFIWLYEYDNDFYYEYKYESDDEEYELEPMAKHIMALHTIQNLIIHKFSHLHLIIAVTLILKHATLLQHSNSPKLALTNADLIYQKANIDVAIQQHLIAHASEYSVEQFAGFIMSTDIVHQPTQCD